MSALYNLTLRQWQRGRVDEADLQQLVDRGLLTEQEKELIMEHEQDAG